MKLSDLTPEERAEAIRLIKENDPRAEPGDDTEIVYYLFPFPKDSEVADEPDKAGETECNSKKVSESGKKQAG